MSISLSGISIPKSAVESLLDFLPYPFLLAEYSKNTAKHLYANKRFREELGYTLEDVPDIEKWFLTAYPDSEYRDQMQKVWISMINAALAKGESSVMARAKIFTKHNGYRWFEVKSSLFVEGIQFVSFVNIDEVVTKEHQLESANHNKNKMLSILSHDLRSSMVNLHALATLAIGKNLELDEFSKVSMQLKERSALALELLETTVHWTKANFENVQLDKKPVPVKAIVGGILETDNTYSEKNIEIFLAIDDQLNPLTDPGILTIIARNLISNAVKFSPSGGVIEIKAWQNEHSFFMSVIDSGLGMDADTIEAILHDQYSPATGTLREKGSGVGLTLCRDLLKKIDGDLTISSSPGKGTEMTISLKQ